MILGTYQVNTYMHRHIYLYLYLYLSCNLIRLGVNCFDGLIFFQDCRRLARESGISLSQETGNMEVEGGLTGRLNMDSGKPPALTGKL